MRDGPGEISEVSFDMNETNVNKKAEAETTLTQDVRALLTSWLRGWRGLAALGLAGVAVGLC